MYNMELQLTLVWFTATTKLTDPVLPQRDLYISQQPPSVREFPAGVVGGQRITEFIKAFNIVIILCVFV